jgi:hypothetical protein
LEALCTDRFTVVARSWSWWLRCSGPSLVVPWAWSWRTPEPAQRERFRGLDAGRRWLRARQPANPQDPRRMAAMPQASGEPSGRPDPTSAMTRPTRGSRINGTSPRTAGTANLARPRTRAARFRHTGSHRPVMGSSGARSWAALVGSVFPFPGWHPPCWWGVVPAVGGRACLSGPGAAGRPAPVHGRRRGDGAVGRCPWCGLVGRCGTGW